MDLTAFMWYSSGLQEATLQVRQKKASRCHRVLHTGSVRKKMKEHKFHINTDRCHARSLCSTHLSKAHITSKSTLHTNHEQMPHMVTLWHPPLLGPRNLREHTSEHREASWKPMEGTKPQGVCACGVGPFVDRRTKWPELQSVTPTNLHD